MIHREARARFGALGSRRRTRAVLALLTAVALAPAGAGPAAVAAAPTPPNPDAGEEKPAPGMKARVFPVKHRDGDDLVEVLRPLLSDHRGSMLRQNDELKAISARDFPENLAALEQAIKRLDVPTPPQPDLEVHIRVLVGAPTGGPSQYPGELEPVVKQLGSTLSYKSYHLVASVTQRLRAGSGTGGKGQVVVAPPVADDKTTGRFQYHLEHLHLAPPTSGPGVGFTVKRLKLALEADGLGAAEVSTGLTLREGEKVVVGTGNLRNRAMIVVISARVLR